MNEVERRALSTLTFNLVPVPDDVWRAPANHVPELHKPVVDSIFEGVSMARYEPGGTPRGVIVQGPAGSGKTHMLGMVRERTQRDETVPMDQGIGMPTGPAEHVGECADDLGRVALDLEDALQRGGRFVDSAHALRRQGVEPQCLAVPVHRQPKRRKDSPGLAAASLLQ